MTVYSSSIFLSVLLFSCTFQSSDRHQLVQPYWQLESIETSPELVGGPGAIDQMAACEKDDAWKFAINGILKTYRGNERCYPGENFTDCIGGWALSGGGRQLIIRESGGLTTTYEILKLSAQTLQLSFESDEAEVVLTYRSIPANMLARKY